MYVPYSHPPLLSQLQSQSSTAPNLGNLITGADSHMPISPGVGPMGMPPAATGTPQFQPQTIGHQHRRNNHHRRRHMRHSDPASVSPSSPPPPLYSASTTAPLINVLNVNLPGQGLEDSLGSSFGGSWKQQHQVLSPTQSSAVSLDDLADMEAFLPISEEGHPTVMSPTTNADGKRRKKRQRIHGRLVEDGWVKVQPRLTEEQERQRALEQQQLEDDDGSEVEGQQQQHGDGPDPCCPERRFGHVAVVRPSTGEMMLFGGRQTGLCYDDLWLADLNSVSSPEEGSNGRPTMAWSQIHKPDSTGNKIWPSARAGHTAVITQDEEVLMFGGGTESEFYGQLYSYNFTAQQWTLLHDYNHSTQQRNYDVQVRPRKGHTAVWDEAQGSMFVYGGLLSLDEPLRDSTVWKYERQSNQWSPMPTSTGEIPPDRTYHVAAFDDTTSSMYVFGGRAIRDTPSYPFLGDLYSYSTHSGVWTKIEASGPEAPPPRMCAASCFHAGRFYVSHGGHTRYLNDSYEYDTKREKWSKSAETPSPLTRPTVVTHNNKLTLFGGCDHEIFVNDCHQLQLVAPSLFDLCAEWLNDAQLIPSEDSTNVPEPLSFPGGMPPLALGTATAPPGYSLNHSLNSNSLSQHPGSASINSNSSLTESPMLLTLGTAPSQASAMMNTRSPFGVSLPSVASMRPPMGGLHQQPQPYVTSPTQQRQQPAMPLPRNVLTKTQRLLKDQGVLPPAPVHPRTTHVPTQPFF